MGVPDRIFDEITSAFNGDLQSVDASSARFISVAPTANDASKKNAEAAAVADLRAECMRVREMA